MTEPKSDIKLDQERRYKDFIDYANDLFSMPIAPEIGSKKKFDITVTNEDQCYLLFELFGHGYRSKGQEFMNSGDPYKIELFQDHHRFFDFIAEYIKGAGYIPILKEFQKNEKGEITNINMTFDKWIPESETEVKPKWQF